MDGLLYANGVIKCKESSILGKDKIIRMIDAESLADAVKVLTESGYGSNLGIDAPEKYPLLINKERFDSVETVKKLAPKNSGIELFLLENDYLDAKAMLKNRLFGATIPTTDKGVYGTEKIKEFIEERKDGVLSQKLSEGINDVLDMTSPNPSYIDIVLDKKYFEDMSGLKKKINDDALKEYCTLKSDGRNILSYLRAKRAGLKVEQYLDLFVVGGMIEKDTFMKYYDDENGIYEISKVFSERDVLESSKGDPSTFEKKLDESLANIFIKRKSDMFTVAPLIHFLIVKETELKSVSVILTGIANHVDKNIIKQRVRDIYA